ncbi:heat shock 70 kDa protein 12B-like [Dreissena polymorpha]|uniref:heat shock 70 kDa protein 12B-like n=1 Tax=Dreissena polymorpha TaxID=45954 RepID=UPI002264C4BB|nr:heat shock 70 kDa protein 12B-like [Dreissena polymorpha]
MEINVLIERKEKELLDKMQDFKRANNYVADKIKGEIETAYSHLSVMNKSLNDSAAHDIQLYMAVKTMKSQLECINNSIEEARKGTPFTEFGFMKNTALVDFLQSTGAFGTIETPQQTLYVNNDCIVTAAISLGVTYTNLAWTLISHSAPRVIEFFGRDVVRIKVPTSLLIQSDGRTLESFGYDAEEKYADFTENGTQNDWYYFERFWLDLNENMDTFRITTVLKDKSGKEMRAVSLISLLIKFFVQRLLTFSRTVGANVTAKDIHLILTVPGNWNSNTKILLQLAVKKTCLKVGKVSIMLESEAAALYCLQLPKADSIGRIRYNKEESHLIPKTGQHFLICDFQEDKLAINLHSMESGMQMEHIITEHDRKLGVSKVVEDFETFMNALAGCEIIAVIKKSHLDEYTMLIENFRTQAANLKTSINRVNISVSVTIQDIVKDLTGRSLKEQIQRSAYMNDVYINVNGALKINTSAFTSLFDTFMELAVMRIREFIKTYESTEISHVIVVSELPLPTPIHEHVKAALPDMQVYIPKEHAFAVLNGATILPR